MTAPLRHTLVLIWLLLVAATALSWWLGVGQAPAQADHRSATIGLMIVAFVKVRFVGMHFMELGHAPWPLRLMFEAWVLVVCAAVIGLYLGA